jgi:hypothetical protein
MSAIPADWSAAMHHWPIAAAVCLLAGTAHAETIRCGSSLVDESAAVETLLARCGEPTSKRATSEGVYARNPDGSTRKVGTSVTEYWTYDRGTQAAPILVTIVEGKIKSIERLK